LDINMNDDNRPDPEELLKQIEEHKRGSLKIFLGAAAGVGKTYAMLKAASQLKAGGEDVVIGYVETHNREDTKLLLPKDIEYISLKVINYKGSELKEFDIDKTLARHPSIVILDELAHTNVIGSRNSKRYQDVLELLNAGVNVYTALNVQHLESLNNIVEQITEIKINETVPDQIVEDADEVVLIDLPPEELIERLTDGKIYPKERIDAALANFFRKGNLTALRELSLRKTAQKVDKQVLEYRSQEAITNVWASNDKLLLVLETGHSSERIIRHAKNLFDKGFSQWFVAYVESPRFEKIRAKDKQRIVDLLDLSRQFGATIIQIVGVDEAMAIANTVNEYNISSVILAQYKIPLYQRLFQRSLADSLAAILPSINLNLVGDEAVWQTGNTKHKINYFKILQKIVYFTIVFGVVGGVGYNLRGLLSPANILMIYLLVMILANKGRGNLSAFIAAFIGTLSFDFFIIPTSFSINVTDPQYLFTFMFLLIIGVTFSVINGNLRFQISKLSRLQQQSELFNTLNRDLAGVTKVPQIGGIIPKLFRLMFHTKFMLLLPNSNEKLEFNCGESLSHYDESIASWVFTNKHSAGRNTDTFAGNNLYYTPILFKTHSLGVLVVAPNDSVEFFLPDLQLLLNNFLEQLAITLERIYLTKPHKVSN
jgi:two-component system sensor histidine kinase KdpD